MAGKKEKANKILKRVMLIVSYNGKNYCGWQRQPGKATIEGELEKAISQIAGKEIEVTGASRTDAGVHALGNVAVFDTDMNIPGEKWAYAVNTVLPSDISVVGSSIIPLDFHPRRCDTEKTYEYTLINSRFPVPLYSDYAWHIPYRLDIEKMRKAASYLIGPHDFKSFCSVNTQAKSTVRTVFSIDIVEEHLRDDFYPYDEFDEYGCETDFSCRDDQVYADEGDGNSPMLGDGGKICEPDEDIFANEEYDIYELAYNHTFEGKKITIRIKGDGFLYNMVRIITGTLVDVGKGRFKPETVSKMLQKTDRTYSGQTAPPQGLSLINIDFMI